MEPAQDKELELFGRQPKPVKVTLEGDPRDVDYYARHLMTLVETESYDVCVGVCNKESRLAESFTIYPRAVND